MNEAGLLLLGELFRVYSGYYSGEKWIEKYGNPSTVEGIERIRRAIVLCQIKPEDKRNVRYLIGKLREESWDDYLLEPRFDLFSSEEEAWQMIKDVADKTEELGELVWEVINSRLGPDMADFFVSEGCFDYVLNPIILKKIQKLAELEKKGVV